jgi:hypothetical protein
MATLFPKRKWLIWEGQDEESDTLAKQASIESYMLWVTDQPRFKEEITKCLLDYIDYGNCFATIDWVDETNTIEQEARREQVGYVGPVVQRISPLDIVFNPIASSFENAPKIVRSYITLGEVKALLERESGDTEEAKALWNYMYGIRNTMHGYIGEIADLNDYYQVDGFDSYQTYLQGDYVELLTFYGDFFDYEKNKFYKNHVVRIVDRHKVLSNKPNPSYFGTPPIWHVGWRVRQDNLWAMGPLDNLVGMQYRIDHIENLKADVFDLITFPPLKIRGNVEDFDWRPFERIYVGDEGDVEMLAPPFQVLQANAEIQILETKMEEMAGAPKEALGFRTPGEKTKYEVQRLENASGRIFYSKIGQFEESFLEKILNGQLELGRRQMTTQQIRAFDNELKFATFMTLTPDDITGSGRIRPVAARHFAEKAEKVQNVTNFYASAIGADPEIKVHFSTVKLAAMFEDLLELEGHEIVLPYVRISEQAQAQKLQNAQEEQTMMEMGTPSGLTSDDFEGPDLAQSFPPKQAPVGPMGQEPTGP